MGTSCLNIPRAGDESAIVTVDPTVVYLLSCDLISLGALSKSFSSILKGSFTYAMKFKESNTWTNLKYKLNNPLQSADPRQLQASCSCLTFTQLSDS